VRLLLPEARRAAQPGSSTTIYPANSPDEDQGPLGSVLVIDDDEDVRRVFVAGLEAYGYRVHEAPNGPAALHMLEQGISADVAVVDFAMPVMNGAVLAEAARRLRPGLPIVFASGYAKTAAFDAIPGATILRKPIQIAELADAVRRTFAEKAVLSRTPAS
jgi:CheY-like chemotaxis protein